MRRIRKTELLKHAPADTRGLRYTITGKTFTACGFRILETDLKKNGNLIRHFTWKNGFLTYAHGIWYRNTLSSTLQPWTTTPTTEEYDAAIDEFCKKALHEAYTMPSIFDVEREIQSRKENEAEKRRLQRLNQRLKELTPPLPKDFVRWVERNYSRRYALIDRKEETIICSECLSPIGYRKIKSGAALICPSCGAHLTATGKSAPYVYDRITLLQKASDGRIVERTFDYKQSFRSTGNKRVLTEICRGYMQDVEAQWGEWYYGKWVGHYGARQCFSTTKPYYLSMSAKGSIYTKNLREIGVEVHIIRLLELERSMGHKNYFSWHVEALMRYPCYEYILKSGNKRLIDDMEKQRMKLNVLGKTMHEALGISKDNYAVLKRTGGGAITIKALKDLDSVSDETLMQLEKLPMQEAEQLIEAAARHKLPVRHLVSLLGNGGVGAAEMYTDYLDMAKKRGMNIRDEIVYRNKRWREFHDRYVEESIQRKRESRIREVNRTYKKIKRDYEKNKNLLQWSDEKYEMRIPAEAGDLIIEGQKQHHCVGAGSTYFERMNNRESFIVFMRKKETPDIPYYTLEISPDGKIIQAYAAYDRKPEWETVRRVLKNYTTAVKKNAGKARTS